MEIVISRFDRTTGEEINFRFRSIKSSTTDTTINYPLAKLNKVHRAQKQKQKNVINPQAKLFLELNLNKGMMIMFTFKKNN